MLDAFDLPMAWFPGLQQPGAVRGLTRGAIADDLGLGHSVPVAAVASHDTASAVCALPVDNQGGRFAPPRC